MNQFLVLVSTVVLLNSVASAAIVFELRDGTDSVALTVSGSFDLSATGGLRGVRPRIVPGFVQPSTGEIAVGATQQLVPYITNLSSWAPFGAGLFTTGAIGSGDRVDLYNLFDEPLLALPTGYTSGSPISGKAVLPGNFNSLGIKAGKYVSTLNSGAASDTVTIFAIPEPRSFLLVGIALLTCVTNRGCRKRSGYQQDARRESNVS